MCPLGGKPLIQHLIELCEKGGLSGVTLLLGHKAEEFEKLPLDQFNIPVEFIVEDKPRGTAGAIHHIRSELDNDFLLLYGDVYVNMDLAKLIDFHKSQQAGITLAAHSNDHPYDSDLMELDPGGKILNFFAKPHAEGSVLPNMVNAGVCILGKLFPEKMRHGEDIGRDFIPRMVEEGHPCFGYVTREYIKDMGTPDRYKKLQRDYEQEFCAKMHLHHPIPAVFFDRDGTLIEEDGYIVRPEQVRPVAGLETALAKLNKRHIPSFIVTNQPQVARGEVTESQVRRIHFELETYLGKHRVRFENIYYCPHHPDRGFEGENLDYKIDCNCRKPKVGLFETADRMFNVDKSKSFMVGDSWRDIEAARNFGIKSVFVDNPKRVELTERNLTADFTVQSINEAVDVILGDLS